MRKVILVVLVLSLIGIGVVSYTANAQDRRIIYGSRYNYEIEPVGVDKDGLTVFKVWGYGRQVGDAITNAKESAVAACLFKGLPGGAGSAPTPAIITEPDSEVKNAEYLEKFFQPGGKYLQYIVVTTDGEPSGQDRLKIKKGYKVAIYVQLMYDALRKQMEVDGLARRPD